MAKKPTYEELKKRVKELEKEKEKEVLGYKGAEQEVLLHREIVENMAEGVYLIRTSDGVIVYANEKFEEMFGYDSGELVNKHVSIVNAPTEKTPEEIANEIMQSLKEKGTWAGEVRNIKKDETLFWCHANVSTFDHHDFGELWVSVHENITESKRTEEALCKSEENLAMAQEVADVGSWDWRIKDDTLTWSDKTYRQFGLRPGEITPTYEAFQGFVHPDDLEFINQSVEQVLNGDKPYSVDVRMIRKDGTEWIMCAQGTVYRDKDGNAVRFIGTQQDITKRKHLEEELRKHRHHLEELVEERTVKLAEANEQLKQEIEERKRAEEALQEKTQDLGERVKELNCLYGISHLVEKLGISLEKIVQRTADLIPPASQYPEITCARIILDGQEYRTEKFRETIWNLASDIMVHGKRIGTVEVCYLEQKPQMDEGPFLKEERRLIDAISEHLGKVIKHKRAEEALHESEEKYKILTENSLTGVHIYQDGKYVFVNDKFAQIHGYKREELLGKDHLTLIHPDQRELVEQRASQRLKGEAVPQCYETKRLRKDGKTIWCEIMVTHIQYRGRPAVMGNVIDISERKQTEEEKKKLQTQILQSEKMAAIGQLAAGVAHEINNPTGFVSSNLKTLSDYQNDMFSLIKEYKKLIADLKETVATAEYPGSIPEQMKRIVALESEVDIDYILDDSPNLIKESREGTERIKRIVIDLKDFAHPGDQELKYTDLNHNLESTLNIVWNEIKYKATVIKDCGDLPEVQCYPQQINQVFMNLLLNAAQAIEKHGEIRIATRAVDGYAEIAISDTGVGIPKKNLSRIFDPFFTTKEVGKGTGLGLNIAYNIVKKHKGTIEVESEVGKGTMFTIRIPVS